MNKQLTAALVAATIMTTPVMAAGSGYDFRDTVFPEPGDPIATRIGNTSWVSMAQIEACSQPVYGDDKCPDAATSPGAYIYSKDNLTDLRGYNLPFIGIQCGGGNYTVLVADNAWFLGNVASENTVIAVPDRVTLNVDGHDAFTVTGKASGINIFEGAISKAQFLRLREAQQVIYEASEGSPGLAFPAAGTATAIDAMITVCGL